MNYELAIAGGPDTIPGGTAILLVHPSTGKTDQIDTDFLKTDTDRFLVISTRTTAREVKQKIEHYDVDPERAEILDTLSIERGYSRRTQDDVHYVSAPDDLDGIIAQTQKFFARTEGKRRLSLDSVTELAYYAGDAPTREAVDELLELLTKHDAVGLFHLSAEVHDDAVLAAYTERFDLVVTVDNDGVVTVEETVPFGEED